MNRILCVGIFLSLCGSLAADDDWLGYLQSNHKLKDLYYFYPNHQDDNIRRDHHHYDHRHDHPRRDHHFDYDHHIERPCSVHDLNCIRDFFANNFRCSPVRGPVPDPYVIKKTVMDIPHSNMTLTINDSKYIGFSTGKFKEFYINKKTNVLVVEVEFDRVVADSPKTVMTFYEKGKEPVEVSDFTIIIFKHLSLTLTVQLSHDMDPSEGHVFTYLSDPHPPFKMGPGLHISKGHAAGNMKWLHELGLTVREALVTQGSNYMAVFLQSKICDFRHH